MRLDELKKAFRLSLPMLSAYVFLGMTYGLLASEMGLPLWVPVLMAMVVYSGSVEFLALTMLVSAFHLPSAVFGMLIVYCLKDSQLLFPSRWLSTDFDWRTLLAVVVTVLLHFWCKSFFLTMAGGTAFYMILTH